MKQVSIYAENKKGTMQRITGILLAKGINILGSVTNDSAEYGIVRMVVSDADEAIAALEADGFICKLTEVIGVEIVEEAVEAARENALANGLANCDFIAGDVLKVLDTVEEKPDLIVLDPPRDGIHPKALAKILAYGVKRMVYISCKPTSLVRDLEMIQAAGYEVKRSAGVDMFVNTGNLETICLLEKKEEITT